MKSEVATTSTNVPALAATELDAVDQRRAMVAKQPDTCPGHEHEEPTTGGITLPDTLRNLRSATPTKKLWRSMSELSESPEFKELLDREFPKAASEWTDEVSRRNFMKIMGASLALAGVAACTRRPEEIIVPYVVPPEQVVPGRPLFFASTYTMEGLGRGIIVESHEGRPTKIEGNPDHPASLGAASTHMQASILSMYDPDRSQGLLRTGDNSTWDRFVAEVMPRIDALRATKGEGLRLLLTPSASPTLQRQLKLLASQFPSAKVHAYDPAGHAPGSAGAQAAFGQDVNTVYQLDQAKVVVSLDSNFFVDNAGSLTYAKQFINGRRVREDNHDAAKMNRLYVVESTPTITGAMADHRERVKPSQIEGFARALLAKVGGTGGDATASNIAWIDALAADLTANKGAAVVIAGEYQSAAVHALVHAINTAIGAVGKTVYYTDPVYITSGTGTIEELVTDAKAGKVKLLFILGGNPVYDTPAALQFGASLEQVDFRIRVGSYNDETSFLCHWHIPESHFLETWSDARAFDGTASIVQPLIAPLYDSKSVHQILGLLTDQRDQSDYELVRATWGAPKSTITPEAKVFENWWREALNKGVIPNTKFAAETFAIRAVPAVSTAVGGDEIVFRPDPNILDGRFANNGWLQELPKPLTKLTWDNVFFISAGKATALGIPLTDKWDDAWGYNVTVSVNGGSVTGPAWVVPGHPDDVITAFLGYGRSRAGNVGNVGVDVSKIRSIASPWMGASVDIKRADGRVRLACTQTHQLMKGAGPRDLIRVNTIEEYEQAKYGPHGPPAHHGEEKTGEASHGGEEKHGVAAAPVAGAHESHAKPLGPEYFGGTADTAMARKAVRSVALTLYNQHMPSDPPYNQTTNQWAMSIDNNACIGCNACVVACQSENNIPIVGKTEVIFGREMHWLRIDTYYGGDSVEQADGPYFQPLPCMHCEAAPCEVVCPVAATQHDDEGLNVMTYNRCVGTKYCSNNCPYKVRRFNFFRYKSDDETTKLMRNPDVSIRTRGVMEKCTYCIQRISAARIEAKKHGGDGGDGIRGGTSFGKVEGENTPLTACQQSCPTEAIVFGSLTDPSAKVVALKSEPTDYSLLADLNARPRTTYMGRFTNPNPSIGNG